MAIEQQEAAAPSGSPRPAGTPTGGAAAPAPVPPTGAFGPTEHPFEPITAGVGGQQNPIAQNPQAALRVLYARFPHPAIARLIDWSAAGQ